MKFFRVLMKVYIIHRSFPSVPRSIDVLRRHQFASVRRPCDDKFIAWPATSSNERGSHKCVGIPMDSLITTAARALAAGDPLDALKRVALRDDAPALALRGMAMAQFADGDLAVKSKTRRTQIESGRHED